MVKTIKESKRDVQLIFATHNANIPVLVDAEKIKAVENFDNKFKFEEGTIDSKE